MFIWAFLYVILLDSSGSQVIYLSTNQRWMDRLLTQAEFIFWTILSLDNSEWPDQFYIRLSSDRKGTFFYWTYGVIWSDRSYNPKLSFAYEVKNNLMRCPNIFIFMHHFFYITVHKKYFDMTRYLMNWYEVNLEHNSTKFHYIRNEDT